MEDKRSKEVLAIEDQKADYAKKRFSMFAGAAEIVTLRAPKYMAGVMIDRFGTEVRMRREDEDILVRTEVEVSPQFFRLDHRSGTGGSDSGTGDSAQVLSGASGTNSFCL